MNPSPIQRHVESPRYAEWVVHAGVARWVEVANDSSTDSADQIRQILHQIDARLESFGIARANLLEVLIYLASLEDVAVLNQAWDAWVDPAHPPCRACVAVQLQGQLKAEFILRAAVTTG